MWARNLLPYHSSRLPRLLGFGVRRSVAVEVRTEEAGGRADGMVLCVPTTNVIQRVCNERCSDFSVRPITSSLACDMHS